MTSFRATAIGIVAAAVAASPAAAADFRFMASFTSQTGPLTVESTIDAILTGLSNPTQPTTYSATAATGTVVLTAGGMTETIRIERIDETVLMGEIRAAPFFSVAEGAARFALAFRIDERTLFLNDLGGMAEAGLVDPEFGILPLGNVRILSASLTPTAAAVPEPASWAMMIAGFAAAGTALRRRGVLATA